MLLLLAQGAGQPTSRARVHRLFARHLPLDRARGLSSRGLNSRRHSGHRRSGRNRSPANRSNGTNSGSGRRGSLPRSTISCPRKRASVASSRWGSWVSNRRPRRRRARDRRRLRRRRRSRRLGRRRSGAKNLYSGERTKYPRESLPNRNSRAQLPHDVLGARYDIGGEAKPLQGGEREEDVPRKVTQNADVRVGLSRAPCGRTQGREGVLCRISAPHRSQEEERSLTVASMKP